MFDFMIKETVTALNPCEDFHNSLNEIDEKQSLKCNDLTK